jgi:hypothetical protein
LVILSKAEQAYLSGTGRTDFTKKQQRDIRYRLRKKFRTLDEELTSSGPHLDVAFSILNGKNCDAAAEFRDAAGYSSQAKVYETERSLLHERLPKEARSPSSSAWQSEGFVNLLL